MGGGGEIKEGASFGRGPLPAGGRKEQLSGVPLVRGVVSGVRGSCGQWRVV